MRLLATAAGMLALLFPVLAMADGHPVNIRPDVAAIAIETEAGSITIERIQDTENRLSGAWTRTSRPCPNFCIQPIHPASGVTTIGELEVIDMLKDANAVVVDSRVRKWYVDGTIPGAHHIPYTQAADRLDELGCEPDFDGWICDNAKPVALFCNGPWCGQSPAAIRAMIAAGFPPDKISYYRGGMQVWRLLGLTVVKPKD